MPRLSDTPVFLAQAIPAQETLLRLAMAAASMSVSVLAPDKELTTQIELLHFANQSEGVLVVDLAVLAAQGDGPDVVLTGLRERFPALRIVCTMSNRLTVYPDEIAWIKLYGVAGLFPQASALRLEATLLPLLRLVANDSTVVLDTKRIAATLRVLGGDAENDSSDTRVHSTLAKLESRGIVLDDLIAAVIADDGFDVKDRTYRFKQYEKSFIGSEAVDALMRITGRSRETSLAIGQLLHKVGIFHHVLREHDFEDAGFFYRFSVQTARVREMSLKYFIFAARGRGGFVVSDRSYLGKSYPNCFVGQEAAMWLREQFELTAEEATALGQTMCRLHVIRHVVDDHDFIDRELFYRFA